MYPAVSLVQEYQPDGQVGGHVQGGGGCQVHCQVQGQIEVESQVEVAVHW